MSVLIISNRKGGAGKTTTAVNLAAEFSAAGKKTLLIDLDTQGHCSIGLGIKVNRSEPSIHTLFTNPTATIGEAVRKTGIDNLFTVPADPLFNHGDVDSKPYRLKNAIEQENLSSKYDIIIIDTPPSLDALLLNGLIAADFVLVPFIPHHLSYEGIKQLIRALYPIMVRENRDLKILGFLPNMASDRIKFHINMRGKIAKEFGMAKILSPIRRNIRLAEAFEAGKPIRYYAPKSTGAHDYSVVANEVLSLLVTTQL